MEIKFEKEYLQELYNTGKTTDKKHRFQPEIIRKYRYCIELILAVPDTKSLFKYKSLNYEALKGDKQGTFSIRVNNQYRIEFSAKEYVGEVVITVCNIIELSNHYKK